MLVCTHATFRFAVDQYGVEKFDDRLIAVDEFHHVSANPDNKLGLHLGQFIARDRVHIVAMTGSYFRGDAEAVLAPQDEAKFDTVTYTYYEQLNGYEYLKQLDIGYFFYSRLLCRRHPEGARPGREDHHPHSQRQFAREHEGQDQGSGAHHRGIGRVARDRPRDRLPARQNAGRPRPAHRRSGR